MDLRMSDEQDPTCHARRLYDLHEFECHQRVRWRSVAMAALILGIIVTYLEDKKDYNNLSKPIKILAITVVVTALWIVWNRLSSYHSRLRDHEQAALESLVFVHSTCQKSVPIPSM